jgi:hypothetical protein
VLLGDGEEVLTGGVTKGAAAQSRLAQKV